MPPPQRKKKGPQITQIFADKKRKVRAKDLARRSCNRIWVNGLLSESCAPNAVILRLAGGQSAVLIVGQEPDIAWRLSRPTAQPQCSLGHRPTAIKLRNSRSRSQAPAWERPCLGGSSLPFPSGALCFWRSGRRLEPPRILHSQAGAWERARVTRETGRRGKGAPRTFP